MLRARLVRGQPFAVAFIVSTYWYAPTPLYGVAVVPAVVPGFFLASTPKSTAFSVQFVPGTRVLAFDFAGDVIGLFYRGRDWTGGRDKRCEIKCSLRTVCTRNVSFVFDFG
eukprot:837720-Rhodomonas_salina.1